MHLKIQEGHMGYPEYLWLGSYQHVIATISKEKIDNLHS